MVRSCVDLELSWDARSVDLFVKGCVLGLVLMRLGVLIMITRYHSVCFPEHPLIRFFSTIKCVTSS